MASFLRKCLNLLGVTILIISASSCSKEEEMRTPDDILGTWSKNSTSFLQFRLDNIVAPFNIIYQDGQSIGKWSYNDVYYYEPGYQLVIYLNELHQAEIYEIVELSSSRLTWCWVDELDAEEVNRDNIGHIIGEIITKAQEGYKLNPELYETFNRVSESEFLSIEESLDVVLESWQPLPSGSL